MFLIKKEAILCNLNAARDSSIVKKLKGTGVKMKQLSVFVENEIGSLAKVTSVLRENKVNLRAIASFDSPEFGILRMVVDKPGFTKEVLTSNGFVVKVTEVLAIELEDKPGNLDNVLHIISEAGLNVNYIYSFVIRDTKAPLMVINLDNLEKAFIILKEHGIKVVDQEDQL